MDTRKRYTKPTVESGEVLEQTSLDCSVSQDWGQPGVVPFGAGCEAVEDGVNVAKSGAFGPRWRECDWAPTRPVVFS